MIRSERDVAQSDRKCILFVVNQGAFFISHRLPIAVAALKHGYDVHVAMPITEPEASTVAATGASVHHVPLDRSSLRGATELRTIRALILLYRAVKPDLVHQITIKPILYGSIAARITKVPAVVNAVSGLGYLFLARGFRAGLRRRAVQWGYRRAFKHPRQRTIFQNPDDAASFISAGIIAPEQTALIRGSGVDLTLFRPQPEAEGTPIVMLPARLLWDKGIGEFVEAAARLKEEGVSARFVLVGDIDNNRSSVSLEQLRSWCDRKVVEWWKYQSDMPATLSQANLVCLPSYGEGLPKVLLEAAACARAIVTTDVPGCREAVRHNDNGLLVPSRDSSALAAALKLLIESPDTRMRMGKRGRERAEAEFGIERVVAANLALYKELFDTR